MHAAWLISPGDLVILIAYASLPGRLVCSARSAVLLLRNDVAHELVDAVEPR